jgi:CDP-paratose 2-epimerase
MKNILVTGGAGFVGSNLCLKFKQSFPNSNIVAFDNLKRRGSELNLARFKQHNISFVHGDVRVLSDFEDLPNFDLIIDCAAEPSVMAGAQGSPAYVIDTNLQGTLNTLELARRMRAKVIFLSTSRVYPIDPINKLNFKETTSRFELLDEQSVLGASSLGLAENFPLEGSRSIYGASKLASELFAQEYIASYGLEVVINRCGVLTGPWQMGKTDQGVIVLWAAQHLFNTRLKYFGFGGTGKQVRDILHVNDLFDLLLIQLADFSRFSGEVYNVGGGREVSVSLRELTDICRDLSGNALDIPGVAEDRSNDIRIYLSDCSKIMNQTGWRPKYDVVGIMTDIFDWLKQNRTQLEPILSV